MAPIEYVEDDGWKKVVSRKRNQKQKLADGDVSGDIRRIRTTEMVSADVEDEWNGAGAARSNRYSVEGYDFDGSGDEKAAGKENLKAEKPKKPQLKKEDEKPMMSLSEAMSKIDQSSLAAFLDVSLESYSDEPVTQLLRYMHYIGRELTEVQFPWLKMFPLEGPWPKLIDVINVPLSDIPGPICKTSVSWILQVPITTLSGFVVWAFGSTITHLEAQQQGAKSGKIGEQPTSPKPHMPIFVTLAMVLRWRPDALTRALPTIRGRRYFQGQDRLPLTVWMMAQASQGYLGAGLYSWARNLLPVLDNTSCNPQSRDLILQLVEQIVAHPVAWLMCKHQAARLHERMIPPPSFEILLRLTFPASSARVKATERFEAVYPSLKEVALTGAPGSKAMKQVIQQIFSLSLKLAGEGNPALAKEATAIAIWSVTENVDCCEHWDSLYTMNIEASVALLKKLVDEWKDHSLKLSSSPRNTCTLSQTMKSFRLKNEKAISKGGANASLYKEADKSCKFISRRLSLGRYKHYCLKATSDVLAIAAPVATALVLYAATVVAIFLYVNPEARTW